MLPLPVLTLIDWVNARWWRWRTVHLVTAAALEQLHYPLGGIAYGVLFYLSHELTQAMAGDQIRIGNLIIYKWKWETKNTYDLLAACLGSVLGNLPRLVWLLSC